MADFTPQQRLAITTVDKNVAVSAGAGSGKTRVLVERFLYILRRSLERKQHLGAGDILAITFTKKAAAEMKERVRRSMDKLLAEDQLNQAFWRQQLQELERAQITTIHSLCHRILKENPVEAGIDPSFQVADEFEGEKFLTDCLKKYLQNALQHEKSPVQQLTAAYGVFGTMQQLQSLLPCLEEVAACEDVAAPYRESAGQEQQLIDEMSGLLSELMERRGEVKSGVQHEQLQLLAENFADVQQGLHQEPVDLTAYNAYVDVLKANTKLKELIKEIKNHKELLMLAAADKAALPLAQCWQAVAADFAAYLRQARQEADFLSFDDLENYALTLLQEHPQLCARYQQKYRYLMVDEFQDTNEKQKQLVYLLCGGDAQHLRGDKLFIVGDPKQSIYRFRGADVSVFAKVRRDIRGSGGVEITLSDNFRTSDTILGACNEVFAHLLGEDRKADIFFEALTPHNFSEVKPELLQLNYSREEENSKRQLEAAAVAVKMTELHAAGIPYGEMAVLLSAMTHCETLTAALAQRQIPFQVVDGKGFYERQEVLDLLNLCAALHNKHREIELAGVLRSPYFGLHDATITALFLQSRPSSCLWDCLQQAQDAPYIQAQQRPLLARAAKILRELRQAASLYGLPELWQCIWDKLRIEAVMSLQENGAALLANVKKLRQIAEAYSAGRQGTLSSWLDYTAELIAAGARETAANLTASDAVTIMTIHKSKGLEFGTVFLPMLDARRQSDTAEIKFQPQLGLGIKAPLPDGILTESSVLHRLKETDKQLEQDERKRQLYVAMTRAKNHLVMSGACCAEKTSAADSWLNSLKQLLGEGDFVTNTIVSSSELTLLPAGAGSKMQLRRPSAQELLFTAPLAIYDAAGRTQFSATALQTYLYCQRRYFYQQVCRLPEAEQSAGGRTLPAYVLGLIIHRALERYGGDEQKALQAAVQEFAAAQPELGKEAESLLHNYLTSRLYRSIPARQQRELRFTFAAGKLLLSGVIDCLAVNEDGGVIIVDYKTGRPPADEKAALGYLYQLAIYQAAAEQLLRRPVQSAQLHFLRDLSCHELTDGQGKLKEALDLCSAISSRQRESEFACSLDKCGSCSYNYLCPRK